MKKTILMLAMLAVGGASAFAASTQQNRDDSLIHIGWSPTGIHIPTILTRPISFGIYLGEDFMIGGEYGKFSFSSADVDPDPGDTFDGEFSNLGGFLRWFPDSNSFYLLLSVHQRDWEVRATTSFVGAGGPETVSAQLNTEATVLGLGIGNQWIMDFGLTLGVDWFVLSGNIAESSSFTFTSGVIDQATANAEFQEAADFLNDISGFPGALIFQIGWAF